MVPLGLDVPYSLDVQEQSLHFLGRPIVDADIIRESSEPQQSAVRSQASRPLAASGPAPTCSCWRFLRVPSSLPAEHTASRLTTEVPLLTRRQNHDDEAGVDEGPVGRSNGHRDPRFRDRLLSGLNHLQLITRSSLGLFSGEDRGLSFYICAHQDDWIYFRGEWAFWDLRFRRSVVIFVTAGNAQCTGWMVAIKRDGCCIRVPERRWPADEACGDEPVHGHRIARRQCGQSAMWFLRLANRSDIQHPPPLPGIEDLYAGTASVVSTIDHTAAYTSWKDLCLTLEESRWKTQKAGVSRPFINAPLYISDSGQFRRSRRTHDNRSRSQVVRPAVSQSLVVWLLY